MSSAGFALIQHLVRKLAHLAEYAILTVLLCMSSEEKGRFNRRSRRPLWCFRIAVAYSLTDEFHQRFVPGRNASLADCGLDSIGGAMGILIYCGWAISRQASAFSQWWHGHLGRV